MTPVVEGVAQQVGHDAREGVELLPIGRVPGTETLRNTVGAHLAPFVVVAVEPDLRDVLPAGVRGDLGRRQVGVEVDDRQLGRVVEIETDRLFALKQESLVNQTVQRATSNERGKASWIWRLERTKARLRPSMEAGFRFGGSRNSATSTTRVDPPLQYRTEVVMFE